ncbi:glutamate receptor 2.7 [Trifolium repens]|nr:glutamate receptor 2.7 [Trifolium repens]
MMSMTNPTSMLIMSMLNQRSQLKGFTNIHMVWCLPCTTGTNILIPNSVYGRVKSTNCARSAKIVMSPTTTSYCN